MTKDLFFEIGTEEIPARFIPRAISEMKDSLTSQFKELHINFESIDIYSTPRRFAICIKSLDDVQPDISEEYKGPSKKIAYDSEGNLTKAILGFLKGKGASASDLFFKEVGKEEYAHVVVSRKGVQTESLLKDVFDKMIRSVVFPKSMRWGGKNLRFVRPIRWLICIFGENHIQFEIEGIKTDKFTKGHRFLGAEKIEVFSFNDYVKKLEDNYVILDQNRRKSIILEQCEKMAENIGGKLVLDEEILNEVNYIVEYPTAFYGSFREEYLALPKEVITTPMQAHQRYFPVVDSNNKLLNKFITVRNGDDYMIDNVRKGNEKVLEARLGDAEFFYKEDTKHKFENFVEKLSTITFQQKLGTILDKSNRIKNLSNSLADEIKADKTYLDRTAYLLKADLTTQMVFEFSELQGIMGKYYAQLSGEDAKVCEGIYEHYLPKNAGDDLPSGNEGILLAIADRMDSLAGFFAIGITPTGSQDPFALRRQTLAVLNILKEKNIKISIEKLIEIALNEYKYLDFEKEKVSNELYEFIMLRLQNILSELGVRYDIIDSVINLKFNTINEKINKAQSLSNWLKNDVSDSLSAYNRVCNLLKETPEGNINPELFVEKSEIELYDALTSFEKKSSDYLNQNQYENILTEFCMLVQPINNLFDSVMIMDKDEKIKKNRLLLLNKIKNLLSNIGDLSKLVEK